MTARLERVVGPTRESAGLLATLLAAARLLELEADSVFACHTIGGRWCDNEPEVRRAYEELRATAAALRKAHGYMVPNPMGGPAVVFDACADAIRAGDSVEFAMANYGLSWRPNIRAKPDGAVLRDGSA